jgi:hypothetical protein
LWQWLGLVTPQSQALRAESRGQAQPGIEPGCSLGSGGGVNCPGAIQHNGLLRALVAICQPSWQCPRVRITPVMSGGPLPLPQASSCGRPHVHSQALQAAQSLGWPPPGHPSAPQGGSHRVGAVWCVVLHRASQVLCGQGRRGLVRRCHAARPMGWPPPTLWGWRFAPSPRRGGPSAPQGGSLHTRHWVRLFLAGRHRWCATTAKANQKTTSKPHGGGCAAPIAKRSSKQRDRSPFQGPVRRA